MQGHSEVHRYKNISIGRAGTTPDKRRGDDKTPLGSYRIARMSTNTPFHRFFGLDYPTLAQAERARLAGVIDQRQYRDIRRAAKAEKLPPQSTRSPSQ